MKANSCDYFELQNKSNYHFGVGGLMAVRKKSFLGNGGPYVLISSDEAPRWCMVHIGIDVFTVSVSVLLHASLKLLLDPKCSYLPMYIFVIILIGWSYIFLICLVVVCNQ